jgi:hypothetical protein
MSGQLHAPASLVPGESTLPTNWIGGWVGPKSGLDAVAKRKNHIIGPVGNRIPVIQPVTTPNPCYNGLRMILSLVTQSRHVF